MALLVTLSGNTDTDRCKDLPTGKSTDVLSSVTDETRTSDGFFLHDTKIINKKKTYMKYFFTLFITQILILVHNHCNHLLAVWSCRFLHLE